MSVMGNDDRGQSNPSIGKDVRGIVDPCDDLEDYYHHPHYLLPDNYGGFHQYHAPSSQQQLRHIDLSHGSNHHQHQHHESVRQYSHASPAGGQYYCQPASAQSVVKILLNTFRESPSLQRWTQAGAGLITILVLLVCILTLALTDRPGRDGARIVGLAESGVVASASSSRLAGSRHMRRVSSFDTTVSDVFVSVKTSHKFHQTRLPVILQTWHNLSPKNTYFFTDQPDPELSARLGLDRRGSPHLVVTGCPSDHSRQALCCKMQAEFETFLATDKKWFCHFDDDQYVNVPRLVEKLREFPTEMEWYLGKPSIARPLEIPDRTKENTDYQKRIKFWFATGGAGFCLSRPLATRMDHLVSDGQFVATGDQMRLPDDVTMGYIVERLAGVDMTTVAEFHSHLEPLHTLTRLNKQISFSYADYGGGAPSLPAAQNEAEAGVGGFSNVVDVDVNVSEGSASFSRSEDPTRFLSIHCHLFPLTDWCTR